MNENTIMYIISGGLESTKVRVAPESPIVVWEYIIPLHPYFLYIMLQAVFKKLVKNYKVCGRTETLLIDLK